MFRFYGVHKLSMLGETVEIENVTPDKPMERFKIKDLDIHLYLKFLTFSYLVLMMKNS